MLYFIIYSYIKNVSRRVILNQKDMKRFERKRCKVSYYATHTHQHAPALWHKAPLQLPKEQQKKEQQPNVPTVAPRTRQRPKQTTKATKAASKTASRTATKTKAATKTSMQGSNPCSFLRLLWEVRTPIAIARERKKLIPEKFNQFICPATALFLPRPPNWPRTCWLPWLRWLLSQMVVNGEVLLAKERPLHQDASRIRVATQMCLATKKIYQKTNE